MEKWTKGYDAVADAREVAKHAFREMNRMVEEFIAFFLGNYAADPEKDVWDQLPQEFRISGPNWELVEAEISNAAAAGNVALTLELSRAYVKRVEGFCARWRREIEKREVAA